MSRLKEFTAITDAEEYFEFFGLEYDESVVNVKRFHIMRKFGELIAKANEQNIDDEERVLEFYRFALIKVYKDFESGYNPSAAEIWGLFEKPTPCMTCSSMSGCSTTEVNDATSANSCSSRPSFLLEEG